jgi:hypothetical protein
MSEWTIAVVVAKFGQGRQKCVVESLKKMLLLILHRGVICPDPLSMSAISRHIVPLNIMITMMHGIFRRTVDN